MKKQCRMCCILSLCLLTCYGLSLAQEGKTEGSRTQAIQNIRKRIDDSTKKRTLEYYIAQERVPKGDSKETVSINTGSVILAGRILPPPYQVRLGKDFIAINDVAVEPRFAISGEMHYEDMATNVQVVVMAAELIAQKKRDLYKQTGNYALVIPQLIAYAKSLDSVQEVRNNGNMVTVSFVANGVTNEVGYLCREMRRPKMGATASLLDQEYLDICSWLREGKCVFVPMKDPPRPEVPSVVNAIRVLLDKKPNPKATRQELERDVGLVSKCFTPPISEDDATVIIANWHRSDTLP